MSTTSEIVERLRGVRGAMLDWAEDFRRVGSADGEMSEKSRAALLGEAADKLDELERENARLRDALIIYFTQPSSPRHDEAFNTLAIFATSRAALAGSGEK
jgi:hypothetical protein